VSVRSTALALAAVAACALPAAASAQVTVTPPDGARIVSARMFQDGQFTAKHESPASIGADLATLNPTYVEALLRFSAGEKVRGREIKAWNTVVEAVRAVNPAAQFSVELNAVEYPNATKLRAMMARVRKAVDLDGWLLDFYTQAARKNPKTMAAAVAYAHANGEFLGGNAFGIAQNPKIPAGTDYIDVQDFDFQINLTAVRKLAQRTTVFFHLGNSPNLANSDGCRFIENFTTARRAAYVSKRAAGQAANDYRFAYPVFFPECERNRNRRNETIFTYNATRDGSMMTTIASLMDQFAPAGVSANGSSVSREVSTSIR
jgi:hypothetical protein